MDFAKGGFNFAKDRRACSLPEGHGTSSSLFAEATLVTCSHDMWNPVDSLPTPHVKA